MNKSNWKGRERVFARFFGAERNPLSGMNAKHTSGDFIHPDLYGECKHRQGAAILSQFKHVVAEAKKEGKIPVMGVSEKGMHGFLIVCREEDLLILANQRLLAQKETE